MEKEEIKDIALALRNYINDNGGDEEMELLNALNNYLGFKTISITVDWTTSTCKANNNKLEE